MPLFTIRFQGRIRGAEKNGKTYGERNNTRSFTEVVKAPTERKAVQQLYNKYEEVWYPLTIEEKK